MAMTRTRYRKQTTLTFLAEQLVAVERELARMPAQDLMRRHRLEAQRDALKETIAQFDPALVPMVTEMHVTPLESPVEPTLTIAIAKAIDSH